ncbi:MAG: CoA pyrophosphatase [Holophaga sp.]|nr:CoA pyrophosphatase [Holophaga sp.]
MWWESPQEAPPLPWAVIERSLRVANRRLSPHKLSPWIPEAPRRAAVAVLLWGDDLGARAILLAQRGHTAPQHAGELAFPGGMVEPGDRDLPATARRELAEELGITENLWELGCFPDGVAKARTRFTPVFFRWDATEPHFEPGPEIHQALLLPLVHLRNAPWQGEMLEHQGITLQSHRLDLPQAPLWGATAYVLKAWLDLLDV